MAVTKEVDSQPLAEAFGFTHQKEKALNGLRGILAGIVADEEVNEKELLFLDAWLKSQQYLANHDDVVGILQQVGEILQDGVITPEELAGMQSAIEVLIGEKAGDAAVGMGRIDELIGFLTGVASDGVLNDQEVDALFSWLNRNETIRGKRPASVIVNRPNSVLEDGIITEEERHDLMVTVNQVTGNDNSAPDVSYESSTEVWEDVVGDIKVAGSTFRLTGEFVSGDLDTVDTNLRLRGAETSPNVNKNVDYLVIGTLASRDWLYTAHGRKIEKGLLLKRKGVNINYITERTLLRLLG